MVCQLHFVLGDILPYVLHVVDLSVWIGNYGFAKLLRKTFDAVGSKRDCLMIQYIFAQLCGIKNRACSAAVQVCSAEENNNWNYTILCNMKGLFYCQFV